MLTEAADRLNGLTLMMELLASGWVAVEFNLTANLAHLTELAGRFSDQHPAFGNLCVVRMSELFPEHPVQTTDRRDSAVYRHNKRDVIPATFSPEE